jgi:hypothetical protein
MPQIFHRSTNTLSKASIYGAVFVLAFVVWSWAKLDRSAWNTRQGVTRAQPVPFSHDHHTAALGIDCRYCHTSVETAASAGIPPTATCMNCHSQVWKDSPMLEPVRESFRSGRPIVWTRLHDLPDFAYFDHSIHVAKGVGCSTCHGRVDRMPLVYQESSLQMWWCLDCHRDPARYLRPRDAVFDMAWEAPADQPRQGRLLAAEYRVRDPHTLTSCSTCHR